MFNRRVLPVGKMVCSSVKNRSELTENHKVKSHTAKIIDFPHVFRPIYFFARFFGQMPFTIVYRSSSGIFGRPQVNKIDALWYFISICTYTALAYSICYFLIRAFSHYPIDPILYVLTSAVNMFRLINFLCGILILIMDMCNRHKLLKILNKFTMFDRKASEISSEFDFKLKDKFHFRCIQVASKGIYFNYKRDIQHAWLYCIVTILTLFLLNVSTYFALKFYHPNKYISNLGLTLYFCINTTKSLFTSIPVIAFTFLLHSLHKRFLALNSFLR